MRHGGAAVETADPGGPRSRAVMIEEHPNISLLKRLDFANLAGAADLFAEDFVWHFFNPRLPDVEGDYFGLIPVCIDQNP
jgi:hypothetical protein